MHALGYTVTWGALCVCGWLDTLPPGHAHTPPPPLPLYQVQPDMPDELYEGKLEIGGKDTFFVTWAVQGPRTTGQIVTMFTRDDSDRMDV